MSNRLLHYTPLCKALDVKKRFIGLIRQHTRTTLKCAVCLHAPDLIIRLHQPRRTGVIAHQQRSNY